MGRAAGCAWVGLALILLAGCKRGEVQLTPVQGKVYYRGQPLPGGTIVFAPDPERGCMGPLATSEIKPDGQYTLQTGSRPGAVPGWHRVTVAAPATAPAPAGAPVLAATWTLPRKFSHPEQSDQVHEVKPGQPNTLDIKLE
jgi:hypothetical protein